MPRFAENTTVTVESSQAELVRLIRAHGATQHGMAHDDLSGHARLIVSIAGRQIRLEVTVPSTREVLQLIERKPPQGWRGWTDKRRAEYVAKQRAQAERQRWRALVLITKAKLEVVADGLSSIEREFLADLLLPDGSTVGDETAPAIARAYESGVKPKLLGAFLGERDG
jgi:hypothetical protein